MTFGLIFTALPLYKRCLSNLALLYWWFSIFLIYLFLFWFLIEGRYFQFGSVLKKCSKSLFLNFLKSKNNPFHVWLKKYLYISNSLKQSQICKKLLTHQHQKWKKKEKMRSLFNPRVVLRSYTVIYFLIFSLGKWPVLEIWFELFSIIEVNKNIVWLWVTLEVLRIYLIHTEVLAISISLYIWKIISIFKKIYL